MFQLLTFIIDSEYIGNQELALLLDVGLKMFFSFDEEEYFRKIEQ